MPSRDLTGLVFGKLTVIGRSAKSSNHAYWDCHCECGADKAVRGEHLNRGRIVSCGCYGRTVNITHGKYKSPEYYTWAKMRDRCSNQKCPEFGNYGGRGIAVDPSWNTFEQFFADMGPRPSSLHSIDRRDNDGPYSKDNCRWATMPQQSRNKRTNVLLTHAGRTQTLTDWAAEVGLTRHTLEARLKYGWAVARALTEQLHYGLPNPSLNVTR